MSSSSSSKIYSSNIHSSIPTTVTAPTIPALPPPPPPPLPFAPHPPSEIDYIDALGIAAVIGYEAETNHCIGLCTATYTDYHFHLALARTDTLKNRIRQNHRLMHACIKGNAERFQTLWKAGNLDDMINLFKPFRDRTTSTRRRSARWRWQLQNQSLPYNYETWSSIHYAGNLLNLLVDNSLIGNDSKSTASTMDTNNRLRILRILLATDIDLNYGTPFVRLLEKKNSTLAKEFFRYPDRLDLSSDASLRIAVQNNLADIVELYCALPTTEIGNNGRIARYRTGTPLQSAVEEGNTAIVNILLHYPDRININHGTNNYSFYTALHMAIRHRRFGMITKLLACPPIDINIQQYVHGTPLTFALQRGETDAVWELLRMRDRLNVNLTNRKNETPLLLASRKGSLQIVRTLLTFPNIDINIVDYNHLSPLHHAVLNHRTTTVKALVQNPKKCNVNLQDRSGRTALCMAVEETELDIVRILLAVPTIDRNLAENMRGYTPLQLAITQSSLTDWAIAKELIENSAGITDIITPNKNGRTCLSLALARELTPIVAKIYERYPSLVPQGMSGSSNIAHHREELANRSNELVNRSNHDELLHRRRPNEFVVHYRNERSNIHYELATKKSRAILNVPHRRTEVTNTTSSHTSSGSTTNNPIIPPTTTVIRPLSVPSSFSSSSSSSSSRTNTTVVNVNRTVPVTGTATNSSSSTSDRTTGSSSSSSISRNDHTTGSTRIQSSKLSKDK